MKKRFYAIVLSLSCCFSLILEKGSCQTPYFPFPSQSAHWLYQYYDDFGQPYGWYHEYRLSGDTLIGTTIYSKINDGNIYAGAVREQQRKVWFYPDTGTTEYLLYDFNLVTGDTVAGIYGGTVFGPNDTVQVVYEDSVPCSDGMHHRIWFSNGANWIEGIGSNNYLLAPLLFAGLSGNDYLECFGNDSNAVFPAGSSGCFTGITEFAEARNIAKISPHPVSSVSRITLDEGYRLQESILYEISGKKVEMKIDNDGSGILFDRHDIPDGSYVLKLVLTDGRTYHTRLLIAGE
ncbi:MAG: hypothetical protein ACKOQ6_10615 [Bacteroidota bacterium]